MNVFLGIMMIPVHVFAILFGYNKLFDDRDKPFSPLYPLYI